MEINAREATSTQLYHALISIIRPRPIAWISTLSPDGVPNLAPFSFFTGITSDPPTVVFCGGHKADGQPKDTIRNAIATGEFVINVAPHALKEAMVGSSAEFPYQTDEFTVVGIEPVASKTVAPPGVVGSPARLECRLHQVVEIKNDAGKVTSHMVIGRVEYIEIADEVLDARGRIDPVKLDTIGRLGGAYYSRTRDVFTIRRPELKE